MSTYRYRGTDGVIDISAHSLVTDDFSTTAFTVVGSEAITSQGMHLQWNKLGSSGSGYIITQKGLGSLGGVVLGTSTTGDVFTEGFSVYTDSAIAGVSSTTGRLQITGASANAALVTTVNSTIQNTTSTTTALTQNCVAPGFAYHDFTVGGVQQVRLLYNSVDQSFAVTNAGLGAMLYQGQKIGTVLPIPTGNLGFVKGTSSPINANTNILTNVFVGVFDSASPTKISFTLPERGHWMVTWSAQCVSTVVGGVAVAELYVDTIIVDNKQTTVAGGGAYVHLGSGSIFVDVKADGSLVELKTQGAVTSGNSSVFKMAAVRIG
jgi:hypothetical protein